MYTRRMRNICLYISLPGSQQTYNWIYRNLNTLTIFCCYNNRSSSLNAGPLFPLSTPNILGKIYFLSLIGFPVDVCVPSFLFPFLLIFLLSVACHRTSSCNRCVVASVVNDLGQETSRWQPGENVFSGVPKTLPQHSLGDLNSASSSASLSCCCRRLPFNYTQADYANERLDWVSM